MIGTGIASPNKIIGGTRTLHALFEIPNVPAKQRQLAENAMLLIINN